MYDKLKGEQETVSRASVMSEKEIERANRYLDMYRSAYNAKDSQGEIDRAGMLEAYYQGITNIPQDNMSPGSNTNLIQANIEGQVALMSAEDIGVEAIGVEPGDAEYASDVEDILEFVLQKNNPRFLLERSSRRLGKFGYTVFRVVYDENFKGGLPKIETINTAYFYPDPNITDISKLQDAEFLIETCNKSIFWARANFGDELASAIIPNYEPMGQSIYGEHNGVVDDISMENYLHIYLWVKEWNKKKKEYELKLIQMSGCGVILSDSSKVDEEESDEEYGYEVSSFPDNTFPFFACWLYEREGSFYALGDIDIMIDEQNLINDIDDQIRINGRLTGNPQKIVGEAAGIDARKLTNKPGLVIMAKDINQIRHLQPAEMAQTPIARRQYAIDRERNLLTRFSDQMVGISQKGVESATESLQLSESGGSTTTFKKLKLQDTLSEVMTYCLKLVQENWEEEKVISILRDGKMEYKFIDISDMNEAIVKQPISMSSATQYLENGFEPAELEPVKDEEGNYVTKKADFDVYIKIGAGTPRNKAFVVQNYNEMLARGSMTPQEHRKLMVNLLKLPISVEMPEMLEQQAMANMGNAGSSAQAAAGQSAQNGDAVGIPGAISQSAY